VSPARASPSRDRAARRARTACSLAERVEAAEDWLRLVHAEHVEASRADGRSPIGLPALYAALVRDGGLPDFPPDVLSALHQRVA
jgi:hypothetical protein